MEICKYYPKFEPNQVLTAESLNKAVDFLEKEDRLTRTSLVGIGIVCGLEVNVVTGEKPEIFISKGCGITSEGFLIAVNDSTLTRYRSYTDPAQYLPFQKSEIQIKLWELLPDSEDGPDIQQLTDSFLNDKAVLLYLEIIERDLKTCTGDDCDEQGKNIEQCVRKLLIKKTDLEDIIKSAQNLPSDTNLDEKLRARFKLPHVAVKRKNELPEPGQPIAFKHLQKHYETMITDTIKELELALIESYARYEPVLKGQFISNPFSEGILSELFIKEKINYTTGIQYFYDFLKDLSLAYNEFKDCAFNAAARCCPDKELFPRHLMLAQAQPAEECLPSIYRQTFIPSPLLNEQNEIIEKAIMLFTRMYLLVKSFKIPATDEAKIVITPSYEKETFLSERSIPYYYKIDNENQINTVWNYELRRRCKTDLILSYNSKLYKSETTPDFILSPLKFNIDGYPFFRVEGYLEKDYESVVNELSSYIEIYNLSFSVIALELSELEGMVTEEEFTGFLKKHSGALEHMAGVPKGGTFLLVYDEDGKTVGDFALPYVCCSAESQTQPTGPRVTDVIVTDENGNTFSLQNGMKIPSDMLAQGLRLLFKDSLDSSTVNQASCFVTMEFPFSITTVTPTVFIGYQPIVLDADVRLEKQKEIIWLPIRDTLNLLQKQFSEIIKTGHRGDFTQDWDIIDPVQQKSGWNYDENSFVIQSNTIGSGDRYSFGVGAVSISKERLDENAQYITFTVKGPKARTNDPLDVGMVFNWIDKDDYWMFVSKYFYGTYSGGGYPVIHFAITHMQNGAAENVFYRSFVAQGSIPEEISFEIRQCSKKLLFNINTEPDSSVDDSLKNFEVPKSPKKLVKGSGVGLISRYDGGAQFKNLEVYYPEIKKVIIPASAAILTRLSVKRIFLQTESSEINQPLSDYEQWFWLIGPRLRHDDSFNCYDYVFSEGIGTDLI